MTSIEQQDGAGRENEPASAVQGQSSEPGQLLSAIANAVVGVHKQFYGKGPVKARAHLSHDLLAVVLEGGLTRGEQMLNEHGHTEEVLRSRLAMQETVEQQLRIAVESILYRQVRSFMSANDPDNDMQIEAFVLEPDDSETSSSDAGQSSANSNAGGPAAGGD